jgi:hypothetical protein
MGAGRAHCKAAPQIGFIAGKILTAQQGRQNASFDKARGVGHFFLFSKSELNNRNRCSRLSSFMTEEKFSNRKDKASPSSSPASLANRLRRR